MKLKNDVKVFIKARLAEQSEDLKSAFAEKFDWILDNCLSRLDGNALVEIDFILEKFAKYIAKNFGVKRDFFDDEYKLDYAGMEMLSYADVLKSLNLFDWTTAKSIIN